MNVLFEDDGQLKAGTLLADNDASLQVEAASGKRQKIKAAHVLLRFAAPSPAEAMARAHELVAGIDTAFPVGGVGRGRVRLRRARARVFRRHARGRRIGRRRARAVRGADVFLSEGARALSQGAPGGAQGRARVGGAQGARGARHRGLGRASSAQAGCPKRCAAKLDMLLYRPDKNSPEWKALNAACEAQKSNPLQLLAACGAIPSTHDYHFKRFLVESFPTGLAFPPWGELPAASRTARSRRSRRSRSTTRRPPRSTMHSRCARSPTAMSRSASTSRAPRSRSRAPRRSTRSRARGCRPCTCRVAS